IVFKGENELRFPNGFFMLGGERSIETAEIVEEDGSTRTIEWEKWTGGTAVKGTSFVWNVTNATRPAGTPIEHFEDAEDEVTAEAGTIAVKVNKYGDHTYFAHVTVKEVGTSNTAPRTVSPAAGAKTFNIANVKGGRVHEITYHYHAYKDEESVDQTDWIRDIHGQVCQNTVYALTKPVATYNASTKTVKVEAGTGTFILYTIGF
ncbi:MAG: hypothetical protein K2K29_01475, partial [Muribaculaceae bacterium]|nr:hypothetical protein [Muribaculaceae bacterium]